MTVHWSTSDLPGQHWDPEPDNEDGGPSCRQPNWRDDPDGLDRLCEAGARQLHGPQFEVRSVHTVQITESYL
ncbi:hypothetical protein ACWCRD_02705 [Streptomyces sp. NPDC002092]